MLPVQAPFLDTRPDFPSMLFALGALLAVSLPLMLQLPMGVNAVFVFFWLLRLVLLGMGIRALKSWQILPLLFGAMALVWQQLGTLIGLQGGIAFLLMLSLLKSYEGKSRRDWQVLVLAMLFLVAGAVLFDQDLPVALWVLFCLLLMTVTLGVLNQMPVRTALNHSIKGFLLSLPVMAVLFVAVPRRDSPLWGIPQNTAAKGKTGISDTMKPGSIGELVQSNEPAFAATFENGFTPRSADLYWRVLIMGEYRNGAWQMMHGYTDNADTDKSRPTVSYQILTEDDKGRIPALDYPPVAPQHGLVREAGGILRVRSREGVRRLRLQADLGGYLPHKINQNEYAYYTALPANTNPRTRALAQTLLQQSGGQNSEAFIQAAYRYFQNQGFAYTLKPPLLGGNNATDDFLFGSKQGFCEHYADAFTVLMRAGGLPARVVTGYQGGEYNREGGFWQIRSKNAHAWTEVWLPEKQMWKRVDPTAAVSVVRIESGVDDALPENEISELIANRAVWNQWLDRSRFYWQQWIVNYDGDRQQNLFARLGFARVGLFSVAAVLLLGLIPALMPVWLWWRRVRRQDVQPLEDGFAELKACLLDADDPEFASAGPLDLKNRFHNSSIPPELNALLDDYIRLNYARPDQAPHKAAQNWYRRVQKWVKHYRRNHQAA
ncbi:MAG: DUF3488 and transglutaminase-like domain-containing protein [Conchiformibius sp.]|nr:DUF3488 and transglutaminase-like domain-containing protein [Conchiformibius sp.]